MSPSVVLGVLLGSVYGLLCHALVGRTWRHLPLYWAVGVSGFFAGYALSVASGIELLRFGAIPLVEATLGSGIALVGSRWWLRRRAIRGLPGPARPKRAGRGTLAIDGAREEEREG